MSDLSYEYHVALAEAPKVHPKDVPSHIGFVAETCLEVLLEFIVHGDVPREEMVRMLRETAGLIEAYDSRQKAASLS